MHLKLTFIPQTEEEKAIHIGDASSQYAEIRIRSVPLRNLAVVRYESISFLSISTNILKLIYTLYKPVPDIFFYYRNKVYDSLYEFYENAKAILPVLNGW